MNKLKAGGCLVCLAGLALLASVISCKTPKVIEKKVEKVERTDSLFALLKKNEFVFKWLSLKLSVDVSVNGKAVSFSGNLRIRKDSAIWISISPALGIEALRALITTDSIKLLNRLDRTYFAGDFKYINNLLSTDLDYDMLQSLIVGNDFSSYQNNVFKSSVVGGQYLLSTLGRRKLKKHFKNAEDSLKILIQDIWIDPNSHKITKVQVKELKENQKLEAVYSSFENINDDLYPGNIDFNISGDKTKLEIKIENSRISATGPLEFPFNASSKYIRVYFKLK